MDTYLRNYRILILSLENYLPSFVVGTMIETQMRPSATSYMPPSAGEKVVFSYAEMEALVRAFNSRLNPFGFEAHPFLMGWYNDVVSPRLQIPCEDPNQVAFCIISNPDFFENSFLPHVKAWLEQADCLTSAYAGIDWPKEFTPADPLDRSNYLRLSNALREVTEEAGLSVMQNAKYIPDYALRPVTRMPVVHVTSAGHVAGVAHFHSPKEAETGEEVEGETNAVGTGNPHRLVGCCLHPYHGGWFGYR